MTKKSSSKNPSTRHVVPNPKGWANKKGGADKATSVHSTKKEAEKAARTQSKKEGSELVIHGKDGQIQRKDSHGHDPHNIKG
ncbi:DUF2188 domain-containing protein [Legionella feeleii]|uniref:DUF2188 domain-containing protein n=1 Tax=Legionella feeleii TaxID=453 RepID=A0A378IT19_9GAMM|nr:DUF2188 domain-containing protein [Legionella feeleii]STX37715.1 Uncharacterised protein [Legionella feeleii]